MKIWLFLLSSFAVSCGTNLVQAPSKFLGDEAVLLATQDQLQKKEVIAKSYIVGFRNDLPYGGLYFNTFAKEYRSHYFHVLKMIAPDDGVADLNYLAALDLAQGRSNVWRPFLKSPLEHILYWGKDSEEVQGASVMKVDFLTEQQAETALKKWFKEGKIWYAEPNYVSDVKANEFAEYKSQYEGYMDSSPWFKQIEIGKAFEILSNTEVDMTDVPIIAVMDSGVDYQHRALSANIWENTAVGKAGCRDDFYGCNTTKSGKGILGNGDIWPVGTTVAGESCPESLNVCLHGTHVAGIIAARPQPQGYGGICPVCKILTVRIVGKTARNEGEETSIIDSSIIAGFAYLSKFERNKQTAVRLVNASFGKSQRSRTVELLVRLLKSRGDGTLVVAAAGNEDTMLRQYPAAFSDVIAVSNVDSVDGNKHPSSNYGPWVDIAAPGSGPCSLSGGIGGGILSSIPGDEDQCLPGTSMASPVVAGIAGLLLLQNPKISTNSLRDILIGGSDPFIYSAERNQPYIQLVKGVHVPLLGTGVVNAGNSLARTFPGHVGGRTKDRITSICGVVHGAHQGPLFFNLIFMMLIVPLIVALTPLKSIRRFFSLRR
jgi:hypothetical protein